MSRKKPRSPGVMLRSRAAGPHRLDDEISADGGKAKMHRAVRLAGKAALRRQIRDELTG